MRGKGRRVAGAALTAGSAALAMTAGCPRRGYIPCGRRAPWSPSQAERHSVRGACATRWTEVDSGGTVNFQAGLTGTIDCWQPGGTVEVDTGRHRRTGAGVITVKGEQHDSVFYLNAPGNANVTISGLTITDGRGTGTGTETAVGSTTPTST